MDKELEKGRKALESLEEAKDIFIFQLESIGDIWRKLLDVPKD